MGFNSVFQCLLDVFPQIDSRLLRAVAIEHSKDADVAVEIVLSEVLPYMSKLSVVPYYSHNEQQNGVASLSMPKDKSPMVYAASATNVAASNSTPEDHSARELSDGEDNEEQIDLVRRRQVVVINNAASSSATKATCGDDSSSTEHTCGPNVTDSDALNAPTVGCAADSEEPTDLLRCHEADMISNAASSYLVDSKPLNTSAVSSYYDVHDENSHLSGNIESEEVILLGKTEEKNDVFGSSQTSDVMSKTMIHENGDDQSLICVSNKSNDTFSMNNSQDDHVEVDQELQTSLIHKSDAESCGKNDLSQEWKDFVGSGAHDCDVNTPSEHSPDELVHSLQGDEDDTLNTVVTRSGQICNIDLLEEIIEDAKSNKKTLFLAMESIMNMMREVELQEKAAEQVKVEAAEAGLAIIDKVEELKEMLLHAKEANDMHAGEVYGEKAILATEVRELQTRVLSLSEERDTSLAILDGMRQTLEARLAEAVEARKAAEQEKLEKIESAQNLLTEQEVIMEKVVLESKILQQEAEENSKLRDFLIERGRIVDTLQGEISVICQDVRLMKEKFDNRIPLSKSFSSSQTSCILASSGSSVKTMASDLEKSMSPKDGSPASSVDGQSQMSSPTPSIVGQSPKSRSEDERTRAERKELLDEGWDLFENETDMYGSAT